MHRLLALLLIALTSSLIGPAPAHAIGTVTVQIDDLRLSAGETCGETTIRISVPYDVPGWSIDLSVYAPNGSWAGGGYYYDGADSRSIVDYLYLCTGTDGTGTFTANADIETHDGDYNSLGKYRVTDYFFFSKEPMVRSRVRVAVKPFGPHSWSITARVTRDGRAWGLKWTQIQVHYLGAWRKLYSKRADRRGVVVWTTRPKPGAGKYRLRLYVPGTSDTKASASREFRVPAR